MRATARPNTAEKTQIDLDRASQIEIERPNETREQTRISIKGSGRKTRTHTAADRPPDAKKFGDTKSRGFWKPKPAAADAAVRARAPATPVHTRPHPH